MVTNEAHLTKRDIVEGILLDKFKGILRPFTPKESAIIEKYKNGNFGVSSLAFALYSNGHNLRGKSSYYPYGLIYEDGETLFSVSYFRKELENNGYIFIVAPVGKEVVAKVKQFTETILSDERIKCKGIYVRFLKLNSYLRLVSEGFLPVKESPWYPEAPEEDETFSNSIVPIENLIDVNACKEIKINLIETAGAKKARKKARNDYNRFNNFLKRNNLKFNLEECDTKRLNEANEIIFKQFSILKEKEKDIGSTPEDHFNSLDFDLIKFESVRAYIGYLSGKPVSLFVGEKLTEKRFALYTPFTLREPKIVLPDLRIGIDSEKAKGFTAIAKYAYLILFKKLKEEGITEVHLGGSELSDLNQFKRYLGGLNDPTYWVVKMK